jgi:hypothetical protein
MECAAGFCAVPPLGPCAAIKGLTDDWLRLIDRGVFKTGIGGSDAHGLGDFEVGSPRNYVRVASDDPVALDLAGLADAYRQGRATMTYGPFVDLTIDGKGPGETAELGARESVELHLVVQSPPWFDVSRVEVYRNGALEYVFDSGAKKAKWRIPVPNTSVVVVDFRDDVSPGQDSWYVAFAMGLEGRSLSPVYSSCEVPPVYLGDLFQSLVGSLPISLPAYLVAPKVPPYYPHVPFAVTNPVFLDVDGKDDRGCLITPQDSPPGWACAYPQGTPPERVPCVCR